MLLRQAHLFVFFNDPIECRLLMYELYSGEMGKLKAALKHFNAQSQTGVYWPVLALVGHYSFSRTSF